MTALPEAASPLYERVKHYILGHIEAGRWARDQRLPSENDLVQALGVSRMTVNRAMTELTREGVLKRVQGVGTFVAAPRPRSALVEVANIPAEIGARGHRHRALVLTLERVVPPAEILASFEFERPREVFHSQIVHYEDEVPVQFEERYVNADLAPHYDRQDFSRISTLDYLQSVTALTEIEHVVSAIAADAETGRHLGVELGEPCLLLHRRTWTGPRVATVNRLLYAGSRHSLGSRYKPTSAP
ncbi:MULTISPECIES: histidine utilization repressor [unclassified Aureimonas]|uniref:histidine utilization repressor n=1 Tax=unclassified Aureimonas TaxID=2615206 RepID=UPI0006F396CC|nr:MULTISPECIES: histidine utilization repressor [unclassified Aureimonas]KQT68960.1 histidine utilization repressor [Aureimonas sp. Leaf460]KQT69189.1 histidine utilization repressor [Aureimonas sp. Leaf427]